MSAGRIIIAAGAVGLCIVIVALAFDLGGGIGEQYAYRDYNGVAHQVGTSPDGSYVFASGTGYAAVWNRNSQTRERGLRLNGGGVATMDGVHFQVLENDPPAGLEQIDFSSGRTVRKWKDFDGTVSAVAFSADGGQFLAATGYRWEEGGHVRVESNYRIELFDTATGTKMRAFEGHLQPVNNLVFLDALRQFLSVSYDNTARLWDLDSGKQLRMIGEPIPIQHGKEEDGSDSLVWHIEPLALCASTIGDRLFYESRLWALKEWRELAVLKAPNDERIMAAAFSPNGKLLVTGHQGGTVRLWNVASAKELWKTHAFIHKHGDVMAVAFTKDGQAVLTGGDDSIPGFNAMAANLPATDPTVRMWDVSAFTK